MAAPSLEVIRSALLNPDRWWSASTITYSFPTTGSTWPGYDPGDEQDNADYSAPSATAAAKFRQAIQSWDEVVSLRFLETSDLLTPGDIRLAFTDVNDFTDNDNTAAYSYGAPHSGGSPSPWTADIWLDSDMAQSSFGLASYDYLTLLHEIGHSVGLKHPFSGDSTLPADYDSTRYSVMSYTSYADRYWGSVQLVNGVNQVVWVSVNPYTPMVYDIAALQARYGADTETRAGDTIYYVNEDPRMRTYYDAGGEDTLDLANHTRPSRIDLTPGSYSSTAYWSVADQIRYWSERHPDLAADIASQFGASGTYTWTDNLGIAFGTVIENVTAGAGADTVMGNDAANKIWGNGGQDYLRGGNGADQVWGGDAFDDIQGNAGNDTEYGEAGDDWVVGGKDEDQLSGDAGNDVVYGNLGNDTVIGGDGADWVRGGQGDDTLSGGDGADWLSGDRGSDTISGGLGADTFNFFAGAGVDQVTDFNAAEGDRVRIEGGTSYTVSQSGADTVVSLGNGDVLTLVGVTASSLPAGWIIA